MNLKMFRSNLLLFSLVACSTFVLGAGSAHSSTSPSMLDAKPYAGIGANELLEILALEKVKASIKDKFITEIASSTTHIGTTTFYTLVLSYLDADPVLQTTLGAPCIAIIEVSYLSTISVVDGPLHVDVETLCTTAVPQ